MKLIASLHLPHPPIAYNAGNKFGNTAAHI